MPTDDSSVSITIKVQSVQCLLDDGSSTILTTPSSGLLFIPLYTVSLTLGVQRLLLGMQRKEKNVWKRMLTYNGQLQLMSK